MNSLFTNLKKQLYTSVDISSLVFLRIAFGFVMIVEMYRYFSNGWIDRYFGSSKFNFTYFPFDFLEPLPQPFMNVVFVVIALCGLLIAIGLYYRVAVALFFTLFSYVFLLDQTRYLNHFYLVVLIGFIFLFIDAHKSFSFDAKRNKSLKSSYVPKWQLWLVRFTIGLPYFFGGIAKINTDWLSGEPLGSWLLSGKEFFLIGPYFSEKWMVLLFSYSGMLLDLLIVPMLLYKRTRILGFVLISLFHLFNAKLFSIGIFPWFMLFASFIYFEPNWFRRLLNYGKERWPVFDEKVTFKSNRLVNYFLLFWFSLHWFLPLRHHLYSGNVSWTEEGHRFAWHMKLRSKKGNGLLRVIDKNNKEKINVDFSDFISKKQWRKINSKPYLIWQFAQKLEEEYAKNGQEVEIYAKIKVKLNYRDPQLIVDPEINLLELERPLFFHSDWIIPLESDLKNRW